MRIHLCRLAAVLLLSFPAFASAPTTPGKCSAPEFHAFDFWIGDWDTFDLDDAEKMIARNHVTSILDGCVLLEDYEQNDGMHGESFTIYDPARKVWHQSWVTTRDVMLEIEGKAEDGKITMTGTQHSPDGKNKLIRGTWKQDKGGVRETAFSSVDGGATWQPLFDIVFRAHQKSGSADAGGTAEKIKQLDDQYQKAVKQNDFATMERLLAPDFVLVTGSGKSYTKADLVGEARAGRVQYEHQEDSEQMVRVFGDTAVITARLWEKGSDNGQPFDKKVWFSDTYVKTPGGWVYAFGQSSLPSN